MNLLLTNISFNLYNFYSSDFLEKTKNNGGKELF